MTNNTLVTIWIAIVSFFLGGALAGSHTEEQMKKLAIENKVAEWRIDSQTGEKSFVWLSPTKIEKDSSSER